MTNESEHLLIDDIHAELNNRGKYYKNGLNDSYFYTPKNNNNINNDENGRKDEEFKNNSEEEVEEVEEVEHIN